MKAVTTDPIVAHNSEQAIAVDQILLVRKNIPAVLVSSLIGCIPLLLVLWNNGLREPIALWLMLHYGVILIRAVHHYSFKPDEESPASVLRYGRTNLFLISLSGSIWGSAGVLFFSPDQVGTYTFLLLTLVCLISGSMNAISSMPPAYNLYASLTILPIVVVAFLQGTSFYMLMSVGVFMYLLLTIHFSRNLSRAIIENLNLKYTNMALVNDLQIQTELEKKANQEKSRFLAATSHDVRQPLHAVNLFADAMDQELSTDNQRYLLGGIRRGLSNVSRLFDALLDISSIDAKVSPIAKSNFQLSQLLENLIVPLQLKARQKKITLQVRDCDYPVYTDRMLLERILGNLISNAVNYTEQGSVEIYAERFGENEVHLHIKDTGIGISQEDQKLVFEEFIQINNPERDRTKGYGLGLAIVQRLIALLDIPLQLQSKLSQGTKFTLQLPLGELQQVNSSHYSTKTVNQELAQLVVLAVDNEADILEGLTIVLKNWGCTVHTAGTVEQAEQKFAKIKPDLVISDFRMPGPRDGIDMISKISKTYADINGIIISGDTGIETLRKAQRHNIMLLHKPIKPVQLHMAISRIIS